MTRRRRWGSQREGTTLVSNQFHVFHSLEHPKRFTELSRDEKQEGGDRGDLGEKSKSEKRREQSSQ